ncbi:3-keto-5-aminohexanoate cleavage protein [Deltaproteobacteria bacterium]|nr:3-keto-5-aminohexanoate cleavage protein [Deltaproteobacteria bacterium]
MIFNKLIINACLTGIVPTKKDTPHVPVTPAEIARDAKKVYDLGASIVHIHARERNGNPSHKKEIYREIIGRIRDHCDDIIITVSTSGRRVRDIRKRMEVLELEGEFKPDMGSLTLGSLNFKEDISINSPETIQLLLTTMQKAGIKPELEIFDTGMASYARYLIDKCDLKTPCYANLILGSLGTMTAAPANLVHLVGELPEKTIWAGTGIGRFAFSVQCLSLAMGGQIRVGIEDSIYMDHDREKATNRKLVERVVRAAEAMGRIPATPTEVREILEF